LFDEEHSTFAYHRKKAILQWLQNPNQINANNLNNGRHNTGRYSRTKNRKYLKCDINELETNSMNRNTEDLYKGISEFKKGYKPRPNLDKDKTDNLLADSHSILSRLKNPFS
jgi:hypothetical protein